MSFREFRPVLILMVLSAVFFLPSLTTEKSLEELLSHYRDNSPSERLYLQIDRELYQPGDTLWFSAFNRDYRKKSPSLLSHFLHISLLNSEGEEIKRENFYLSKARGKGDILLPTDLNEGDYSLLAYTSWMKKGSPADVFKKTVKVRKVIPAPFSFRTLLNDSLYTSGQKLEMDIIVETPGNKLLNNLKISWAVFSGEKRWEKGTVKTGEQGIARLEFEVPELSQPSALFVSLGAEFMDVEREATILIPTQNAAIDLQFLPEGGTFVSGLKNKIAFKALNVIGDPLDLSGYLEDENGNKIVDSIRTAFKGMGHFSFIPESQGKYYFIVSEPANYAGSWPLPEPDSEGLVFQLENKDKQVEVFLTGSNNEIGYSGLVIYGFMNDSIVFKEEIPPDQKTYNSSFRTEDLPAGIIRFCVIKNKQALLERLVFVNPEKQVKLQLKPERSRYRARDKVNLEIIAKDFTGQPVEGSFSLSIANIQRFPANEINFGTIGSWFLLNSELRGEIPQPDYYFSGKPGSIEALDLVMLTHGWRGFSWEEVIRIQQKNDYLDINPEALRGRVETPRGKAVKRANVTLLNTKIFGIEQTSTDKEGYFYFTPSQYMMLNMNDMTLSAETASGNKNVEVSLINTFHDSLLNLYRSGELSKINEEDSESKENIINLELDQPIRSFDNPVDITYGYFQFEEVSVTAGKQVIDISDEELKETVMKLEKEGSALSPVNSNSFIDILRQVDPGFTLSEGGKVLFRGSNSIYANRQSGALFVLNGVPVGDDINQLNFVDPGSIEKIVITKNASAALKYRGGYLSGLIEITTKEDVVFKNNQDLREKNISTLRGFRLSRNFYSPDYSKIKKKDYLDLRSTIYWNADIQTDEEGKARVSFFNPDVRSGVIGVIEGWSKDGRLLGTGKVTYEIY